MPRALVAFHAAGFESCADPGDFRAAPFRELTDLLPSGAAIGASAEALHELVGELAYRWRAARDDSPGHQVLEPTLKLSRPH